MKREIVETRFGQMHVRSTETRGRSLVALHMSPLSSTMWRPLMDRLQRWVVAPDRLGFGFSDVPSRELTMDDYATATLDALDALGVEEFDVLGEHTGSVEAVALAHLVPDRIGTIGLIAVPAYSDAEKEERLAFRGIPPTHPTEDGSHFTDLWKKRLAYRTPPYDLDVLHRNTVEELMSAGPYRAYRAVFEYPMLDELSSLDCDVVVFAPHDDLITQTARARTQLPAGSVYIDLPDLALDIWEIAPDDLTALVSEHLGGNE
jgi:pimeloyl-ACP methyl ester carboxylesterase